jgi:hypothetical protein
MSAVAWSFSLLGVILYPDILLGTANSSYLHQSAQFIGAAAAMTEARRATLGQHLQKRISIAPSVMEDPKPGSLPDFEKKPEEKPVKWERPNQHDSKLSMSGPGYYYGGGPDRNRRCCSPFY